MVDRAGLLVSLGGDGTMLRTMRLVEGRNTPVLGVNVGRLGFLAEVDLPDLPGALSAIDKHQFTVEPRTAVRTVLPDGKERLRVQRHRPGPGARATVSPRSASRSRAATSSTTPPTR